MHIVPAMAGELSLSHRILFGLSLTPEPREVGLISLGLFAAVLVPLDVGLPPKDAGAFPVHVLRHQERPDIEPNAMIQIRIPANRLLRKRLPADEDVVRCLALEDGC